MTDPTRPKIPFHMDMEFTHGIPREIWPGIRRIVAPNDGPLTHNGTNSYIVGQGDIALIDPGPKDDEHLNAILKAIKGETLSHIFLTHTHKDHSGLICQLKQATGAKTYAHKAISDNRGARRTATGPLENDFIDFDFQPDHPLQDNEIIKGSSWAIKAIHTPGHAPDHFCFEFIGQPVLFTGDHVMAWNTSVIIPPEGNMAHYLASLSKLLEGDYERFMPGHGGQARVPLRLVKAYLMHRKWRESAILEHIQAGKSTIPELVPLLYPNAPENILAAAALSILAHAEHLCDKGKITSDTTLPALDSKFTSSEQVP